MKSMTLRNIPKLDYATTEAINTLASNVIFSGSQLKSIMMTSCDAHEGKSFINFLLAERLAYLGYSVVMVDGDLRKSVFLSRYDVASRDPILGLTHYLAGQCGEDQIEYATNIPNLFVVPSGKEVINSLPLLTSAGFSCLMKNLSQRYNFVLVDAPPVGLIVDAAMIANVCDGTLFTVTNERISRRELTASIRQIQNAGCTVLGIVLNKVVMETHKSRKYYYKSYYSHYTSKEYSHKENRPAPSRKPKGRRAEASGEAAEPPKAKAKAEAAR